MSSEAQEYINYRLARAKETLEEAELMLANQHLNAAVNRLYYACFYAVSALLLTEGKSSSKHSGVRALFDRGWVKTGRMSQEMGRLYRRLFAQRQRGDYDDLTVFSQADVKTWLIEAREFVAEISDFIRGMSA